MNTRFSLPFFVCLVLFSLTSCMKSARLTVLQPAQMKIADHITTIAIVDRSKPSNGWLNTLEGLVTGESIGQDRRSRQSAVEGVTNALTRTPRFQIKTTGIEMTGSKAGNNLPAPLDWREIERICADYDANAVLTIESFDSDNFASARRVESKSKDKTGKQIVNIYYNSEQRTSIRMGWRLYDPKTKIITDEFVTNDYLTKTGRGDTEKLALSNLPSPQYVARDVAHAGGINYGMRIAPVYVDISRQYYGKAKGYKTQMKEAARFAQGGNWERAAKTWKSIAEIEKENQKSAGRAAYNMAVAAEMRGNLEVAQEWAEKSWTRFGNKKAKTYINTLKMRQNDLRKVESQLNKKT